VGMRYVGLQSLAKYKYGYGYIVSVIDVFSKYLHIVPLRVKTDTTLASAILSILGGKIF
jgi:hypothetical protein